MALVLGSYGPPFLESRVHAHLAGERFVIDADVKQAVTSWLHTLEADFFSAGI
jgi:hypothetical protein